MKAAGRVVFRAVESLEKYPGNPRQVTRQGFEDLTQSIKKHQGFFRARPLILSNRTGRLVILGGNHKYEAAKAAGLAKVPTFLIEGLTEEEEREYVIRDNTHEGAWDYLILKRFEDMPLRAWGVEAEPWVAPDAPAGPATDRVNVLCPNCGKTVVLSATGEVVG